MHLKLIIFVTLWTCVLSNRKYDYSCNRHHALKLIKKPAYQFSVDILKRVVYNEGEHFVYAPMSSWMQLAALGEGATNSTFREIWKVTRQPRNNCYKKHLKIILAALNRELKNNRKRKSLIIIDKMLAVKYSYKVNINNIYGLNVLPLYFKNSTKAADRVNAITSNGTEGEISDILYYNDFINRDMLLSDANCFKSEWRVPFNSAYTTKQPFYDSKSHFKIGEVNMMNQIGYFNIIDFPMVNAKVLELPCSSRRLSMLVLLPRDSSWLGEIFYALDKIRLTSIFDMSRVEGPKLVNVSLPRMKQMTETENLSELIYDMGVEKIFDPDQAEFKRISNYKMAASFMTQITKIEINERGITASADTADYLVNNDTSIEFVANRPFVYIIVDKQTEFILYAGAYSQPTVI